jgi:hypothetical protein
MVTVSIFENIIANYLPYIAYAVLAVIFIWTLSEAPVKRRTKGNTAGSEQATNQSYY